MVDEPTDGVLFVMEPDSSVEDGGTQGHRLASGVAAEHEAIATLLRLGHKVAVPVVDDDGVDLVVNYRTKVQVKSTVGARDGREPRICLVAVSYSNGQVRSQRDAIRSHVDVLLARVEGGGWWVIPRSALPSPMVRGLALDHRYDQWREAWHVFDSNAGELAA